MNHPGAMPDDPKPEEPRVPIEDSLAAASSLGEANPAPPKASPVQSDRPESESRLRRILGRWVTIRDQPSEWEKLAAGLLCVVLVLLVWGFLTWGDPPESRMVSPSKFPSLGETLRSFPSLWFDRALARSTVWSLSRVLGGFLLAAAFAVPLGVVAAAYPRVNAFFRPISIFGRNVPIAAMIPLTLMWFGLGETQKVMFIFLASVAFIFFDTANSVDAVSNRFLDTAYTLGARVTAGWGARRALWIGLIYAVILGAGSMAFRRIEEPQLTVSEIFKNPGPWVAAGVGFIGGFLVWFPIQAHQAVRKVLFPLALPDIVNSLRLLFGLAFGYIMLAEVINSTLGLGSIINFSQRRGPREHIYLILIVISLVAFSIDRLVFWAQKRWFPYREHAES
ncbi:MAG: ABC transporter permease subunit [Verrucomicrobiae bacterium]|nr:ABC transporter permease subunit [Verrucomicrobiae bacterium]